VDENDCVSRVERGPYWVIDVIAYVSWVLMMSLYSWSEGGLTSFIPGAVRRRDGNAHRTELVEYIWDKLERA
jgi:hypothetical protein